MNFKEFLIEAPKPRYRLSPDGKYKPVAQPTKRVRGSKLNVPTPTYPQREPISNLEKTTVDFDPAKVGRVAKPMQRVRAGEEKVRRPVVRKPVVAPPAQPSGPPQIDIARTAGPLQPLPVGGGPTPVQPPSVAQPVTQPTPPPPAGPYKPLPAEAPPTAEVQPTPQGEPVSKQIIGLAKAAAANGNTKQIDQLIQLVNSARQSGFNGNNPTTNILGQRQRRKTAEQKADQIAKQLATAPNDYKQSFLQRLSRSINFGR